MCVYLRHLSNRTCFLLKHGNILIANFYNGDPVKPLETQPHSTNFFFINLTTDSLHQNSLPKIGVVETIGARNGYLNRSSLRVPNTAVVVREFCLNKQIFEMELNWDFEVIRGATKLLQYQFTQPFWTIIWKIKNSSSVYINWWTFSIFLL